MARFCGGSLYIMCVNHNVSIRACCTMSVSVYVHVWIPFTRSVYGRYTSVVRAGHFDTYLCGVNKFIRCRLILCYWSASWDTSACARTTNTVFPSGLTHTHFRMEITAFYFKQIDYYCMAKVLNKPTKFAAEWCKLNNANKMRCALRAINLNRSWQGLSLRDIWSRT